MQQSTIGNWQPIKNITEHIQKTSKKVTEKARFKKSRTLPPETKTLINEREKISQKKIKTNEIYYVNW